MFVNTHTLKHTQENNIVATRPNQISYWSCDETHAYCRVLASFPDPAHLSALAVWKSAVCMYTVKTGKRKNLIPSPRPAFCNSFQQLLCPD